MADSSAPCHAETTLSGDQSLPGDIGTYAAIAQDELGKHGKDRPASGALHAPDGGTAEANASIMRVTRQRATITGRCVSELKAKREDAGRDALDKGFAIITDLRVAGFISEDFAMTLCKPY